MKKPFDFYSSPENSILIQQNWFWKLFSAILVMKNLKLKKDPPKKKIRKTSFHYTTHKKKTPQKQKKWFWFVFFKNMIGTICATCTATDSPCLFCYHRTQFGFHLENEMNFESRRSQKLSLPKILLFYEK